MSWTDERIEVLRRLWADGLSASQIANNLGGVTRNAVIGKIHRLGLSGRVKAPQARAGRQRANVAPSRQPMTSPQPRVMAAGALAVKVVEREVMEIIPLPEAEVVPLHGGVTLFELGAAACRWPIGDPSADAFLFCGSRTQPGEVYCRSHAELAFPARRKPKGS